MRILVVDGDTAFTSSLVDMLRKEYETDAYATTSGEGALLSSKDFDMFVLNLTLPDVDGLTLIKQLRDAGSKIFIIARSAFDDYRVRVESLRAGADDCVESTTNIDEIVMRVATVALRVREPAQHVATIEAVGLRLDVNVSRVSIDNNHVHLTEVEYLMLRKMFEQVGSVVTKEMFLDLLYKNKKSEPELKIIDVFISKLRKKLSTISGGKDYIETVWGRGYTLIDPATHEESALLASA